jgi:hypothetical protein
MEPNTLVASMALQCSDRDRAVEGLVGEVWPT